MSENTQSAKCTQEEWDLARAAGLLIGTTSEEVALHKFAESIRAALATQPAAPAEVAADLEFDDYPVFHEEAMGCGLEDRGITDRYEAMRYGWEEALERVEERITGFLENLSPAALASPDQAPAAPTPQQISDYLNGLDTIKRAVVEREARAPAAPSVGEPVTRDTLRIGGRYNWKGQPERLVYMGLCEPRNGRWHQFAKVDAPTVCWSEVTDDDLRSFEATPPAAPAVTEPDPLQGAADWIKSGLVDASVADIQSRLLIGYNRARRLFDGTAPAAAVPESPAWIDVKDRVPTHLYSVLGVVTDGPFVVQGDPEDRMRDVVSYSPERGWLQHDGNDSVVVTVSHWQEMADLP